MEYGLEGITVLGSMVKMEYGLDGVWFRWSMV